MSNITNWDDIVKKEARGINDYDLGEVHEVEPEVVVTKKGVVDKDKFYLPKSLVERFDGDKVWLETKSGSQSRRKTPRITAKTNSSGNMSNTKTTIFLY